MADQHIHETLGVTFVEFAPPFEPEWAPRWVWSGDESHWQCRGDDRSGDGPWVIEAHPPHRGERPRLDITLRQLGVMRGIDVDVTQAQALRKVLDAWLEAVAVTGGTQ